MRIGIPKEIKNNENRVGMTPAGVAELIRHGHEVMVQHTAGENSGFSDAEYEKVGARILPDIESVYREAEMIVKVKEPIKQEYKLIRKDQLVFTYFHFACEKELTEAMIESGAVCLAYETVETDDHHLPLLIPICRSCSAEERWEKLQHAWRQDSEPTYGLPTSRCQGCANSRWNCR